MGAGADLVIRIATKGANIAKAQLSTLGKTGANAGGQLAMFAKVGVAAAATAVIALAKGVVESVQAFTSFEDKLNQSLAIMQTTEQQQKAMAMAAREVATETTISADQSAEAFFFLASAGLDAEQSIAALPQVAAFAQAGMFDMATATDLATDAQSALGLTSKDAQQNLMNLTRVTDVLVKANTLANASVQQFSEALTTKAGAALKVVNKDVEEGVAVLAAFADRGVKGAEGGEKLNQVLRDIPRATAKNSEAFKALGLEMFDSEGKMKNVADIVEELDRVLGPMSDEMKAATLDQLGLNRGVADAVKILSGSTDQIRNYEHELRNAGGTTQEVAEKQLESFKAQVTILRNQLNNLAITIGEDLVPFLKNLVENTQIVVERFQNFRNRVNSLNQPLEVMGVKVSTLAKVLSFALFPGTSLVVTGLKKLFKWIGKNNDIYAEATAKADQLTGAYDRQKYYLGFVATKTEEVVDSTLDLEEILDGTNYTVSELTTLLDQNGIALDENAKEALKTAEAYEDGLLGGLQSVLSALDQLQSIQDKINNAEKKRNQAVQKQIKAEEDVEKAQDALTKAKEEYQKVQGSGLQVTAQEELAILNAQQAVNELTEAQDGSREMELQLLIAKENLNRVREESTAVSREEENALRNIEQAEKDLVRAEEIRAEAVDKVKEAQQELNKVTEQSFRNTLEYAIAQEQLTKALASFGEGTKGYEDAIKKMSAITGIEIGKINSMYDEMFAKQSRIGLSAPSISSGGGGAGGDGGAGGGLKFPPSGGAAIPIERDIGGGLAERRLAGGGTIITVNTGSTLGTVQEIEEAVAKALQEGARRGINVAF